MAEPAGSVPAFGNDGTLYLTYGAGLVAFDPVTLTPKWTNTLDDYYSSPAVGKSGTIYVANGSGDCLAFHPRGTNLWRFKAPPASVQLIAGFDPRPPIAIGVDEIVYTARPATTNSPRQSYAIRNGQLVASIPIFPESIAPDGTLYAGTATGAAAFSAFGVKKWETPWPAPSAIAEDGTLYSGKGTSNLVALTPQGTLAWSQPVEGKLVAPILIGTEGTIYAGAQRTNSLGYADTFYVFTKTGELLWKAGGSGTLLPTLDGGAVLFAMDSDAGPAYPQIQRIGIDRLDTSGETVWREMYENLHAGPANSGLPMLGSDGALYIQAGNSRTSALRRYPVGVTPAGSSWAAPRATLQNTARAEPPWRTIGVSISGRGNVERSFSGSDAPFMAKVTLTAVPVQGASFIGWEGDVRGTNRVLEFLADSHKQIRAVFTPTPGQQLFIERVGTGLRLSGIAYGTNDVLQTSDDLVDWRVVEPFASETTIEPGSSRSFFRSVSAPSTQN